MPTTKIEWTDATWSPVTGCTPISAGCEHCYARRMAMRLRGRWGYPKDEPFGVTLHPDRLDQPLRWKKPRRIFVCSMGDLFHPDVQPAWFDKCFAVMEKASWHTFQVLTKRPRRARLATCLLERMCNLWLGVTIESGEYVDRINHLKTIDVPIRFLSLEPLLGPLPNLPLAGIDWVIVGAETGPGARPMDPDWARDVRDQCRGAGIPFFFKKLSGGAAIPADLQVREFPGEKSHD